jgi:hypothetical protein
VIARSCVTRNTHPPTPTHPRLFSLLGVRPPHRTAASKSSVAKHGADRIKDCVKALECPSIRTNTAQAEPDMTAVTAMLIPLQ